MPDKKNILIGEDERPLAKALQLKLEGQGFGTKAVFNGEDVVTAASQDTYDLILLDLIMPKLDGFSVLQKLKDMDNKVPIIVTSNLGQPEDVKRAKELGARDYLVKSNTPLVKIVEYIQNALK